MEEEQNEEEEEHTPGNHVTPAFQIQKTLLLLNPVLILKFYILISDFAIGLRHEQNLKLRFQNSELGVG